MLGVLILFGVLVVVAILGLRIARQKNIDIIVVSAIKRKRERADGLQHVFFCFVDHYEPLWMRADEATGRKRVEAWRQQRH